MNINYESFITKKMFRVNHIIHSEKNHEYLEVFCSDKSPYAKIYLNQGSSAPALTVDKYELIKDMSPMTYEDTYSSSILFPFANRIKNCKYKLEDNT
jgi:aldose 1-epimerase